MDFICYFGLIYYTYYSYYLKIYLKIDHIKYYIMDSIEYILGRVKWFDTKKGFGFIQEVNDPTKEHFVHHARINSNVTFSTLYDGEYVSFKVVNDNNKSMADDIKGVGRGLLLCETRKIKQDRHNDYKHKQEHDQGQGQEHEQGHEQGQGQGQGQGHDQGHDQGHE